MLADNFKKAGVDTERKLYNGTTHEFFGMAAVVPAAKDAQSFAVDNLKSAFNK
jgi:acetyl esterase